MGNNNNKKVTGGSKGGTVFLLNAISGEVG